MMLRGYSLFCLAGAHCFLRRPYFVSETVLRDESSAKIIVTKHIDAARIPYLVFPGNLYRLRGTGRLGDVKLLSTCTATPTSPFIVADIGSSSAALGEASIPLFENFGGSDVYPRNGGPAARGDPRRRVPVCARLQATTCETSRKR